MRATSIIITLLGIVIAGGSVMVAREVLNDRSSAAIAHGKPGMADVIVARSEIGFGQPIEAHLLTTQAWPVDAVPPGAFVDYDQLLPDNPAEPRRAKRALAQGELVLASKVSEFGEKVTIVQTLGKNTRAMAIEVDAVTAVGGFVTPGDKVDIVLTQGRKDSDSIRAVTILQNIRVIGVDQQADENSDRVDIARTITVEVTPEQGQRLALAQKAGTLSLTLRTLDGVIDEPLDMVDLRDLLREKSPVPEQEAAKTIVRVRRANEIEEVELRN